MDPSISEQVEQQEREGKALFAPVSELLGQVEQRMYQLLYSSDSLVEEVSTHHLRSGGKRVRPALVLLTGSLGGAVDQVREKLLNAAAAVELIHMATLVHDDIVDESGLRRGVPTVNARWDDQIGVLSGDYLFARAFTTLARTGDNRLVQIMADVVTEMSIGEIKQLSQAYGPQTEEDYLDRVFRKTACFISQSCLLGGVVSNLDEEAQEALSDYGYSIGVSYQLIDDILDFVGTEEQFGKPVGSDVQAGLYTLPLLYALDSSSRKEELQALISRRDITAADMNLIMELVRDSGGIEYSYTRAAEYGRRAKEALQGFEPSPARRALLGLVDFIQLRSF